MRDVSLFPILQHAHLSSHLQPRRAAIHHHPHLPPNARFLFPRFCRYFVERLEEVRQKLHCLLIGWRDIADPTRRGLRQPAHPCCVRTGWIKLPTRACPFGTSQTPQGGVCASPPIIAIKLSTEGRCSSTGVSTRGRARWWPGQGGGPSPGSGRSTCCRSRHPARTQRANRIGACN